MRKSIDINDDFKENNVIINEGDSIRIIPKQLDLKKLYIELTTKCNFDCITCIRNSWSDSIDKMANETIDKIFKQIDDLPELETVHFGGFGEPLTHPRFIELATQVKDKGYRAEVITNGQLMDQSKAEKLIEIGFNKVVFSIDAPKKETLESIRKNADIDKILKNIKRLSDLRTSKSNLDIWLEFVAMKSNIDQLGDLIELASELNLDGIIITNLIPYTEDMVGEELYDTDEEKIKAKLGGYVSLHTSYPEMKLRTDRKCNFIKNSSASINWKGEVVPCYPLLHNYQVYIYGRCRDNKSYNYGNVNEKDLKDIWQQDDYVRFRSRVKHGDFPSCTDCKYVDGCSMVEDNSLDCWGNQPTCADCLWYRQLIVCP